MACNGCCVAARWDYMWHVMVVVWLVYCSKMGLYVACNGSCTVGVLQQDGTVRSSEKCHKQQLEDYLY